MKQNYEVVEFQAVKGIVVTCNDNKDRVFRKLERWGEVMYYYCIWKNEKPYGPEHVLRKERLPKCINAGLFDYIERGLK